MKVSGEQLLQELRSTLSKMELSLDAIDDAIVWVNGSGKIKWSNTKFSQLVHLKNIEILDQSIAKLLPLKNKGEPIEWKKLFVDSEESYKPVLFSLETKEDFKYLEVTARNFHKAKEEISIIIVLHDVTEKHLNEEKIKQANQDLQQANIELAKSQLMKSKLAAIVESTDDAIISRSLTGEIESWNKGAERLYGYKAEEIMGKSVLLIYPPNKQEEFYYATEQLKSGNTFELTDTERVHKDGHLLSISVTISPIKNEKGEIIGSCSIARDISELKKMIALKNEFISTVSHELRTPLTSIQGSLALLISGVAGDLPEKAKKLLKIGKENSERLVRLINDILDIQKIESGRMEFHFEPINIGNLIHEALLINQNFAEQHNITIDLVLKSTGRVNVDHDKLLQVLTNLISNAVKFSSSNDITITASEHDDKVRVAITNKGLGIPKEFHARIFEKFSQAKNIPSRIKIGTGLGLSISKEIIEKHEGKIGFSSEENKETTFYFELPVYKQPFPPEKFFEKISSVLICENDKNLANYLKKILEGNAFKAIITSTAFETKKIINEQHIDALLLDLALPDQDGIKLIKELKNINPNLLIIVISVVTQAGEKKIQGNSFSLIDWIEKPIDLNRLVKAVKLLKKQSEINTPNILHVEDDTDLMQIIAGLLENEANIYGISNIKGARELLEQRTYDLVILDLMLPDGSGIDLLPIISEKNIPVLVFTAFELPHNYSNYVIQTLIKTQGTPDEFVRKIKAVLHKNEKKEI